MKCKFCGKEYRAKNKYSISGHLAKCEGWKKYKENILTKCYLYKEYIVKERSAIEIANEHGLRSAISIIKLLKKYSIPTRNIKESKNEREKEKRTKTNIKKYGIHHNFCKDHPSRKKWEKEMFLNEGITNVRQRREVADKIQKKSLETKYRLGLAIRPELLDDWTNYKRLVHKQSNKNFKENHNQLNPKKLKRGRNKYHLDHIYSKYDGFINNIPVYIISHPVNLQLLPESVNISKGRESEITLNELYNRIEQYEYLKNKENSKN